jgi:PAS domain S-box-containing protein
LAGGRSEAAPARRRVGAGVLRLPRPLDGLVRAFARPGPGGVLARRLLPAALLAPPAFAALRRAGEAAGLFGPQLGLALTTLATMLFLVLVVGRTVRSLEQAAGARRAAEESLRSSEERFRLLVQGAWDYAIFMLAVRGWVASWNLGAERLTGYAPGDVLGRDYRALFTEQDAAAGLPERLLERAAASGHVEDRFVCERKDGTRIWANAALTALRHEDGRLRGFVMVTRDVSERRRAEQAIHQLNSELRTLNQELEQRVAERTAALEAGNHELRAANAELESFSYSVSHDLRAPLRAITGFARILQEEHGHELPPAARDHFRRIQDGARQMGQLVDDLLAFSRLQRQAMAPQPVDLGELVRRAWSELAGRHGDRKVELLAGDLPVVEGDPSLLRQVLLNLLDNALKYTRQREVALVEVGWGRDDDGREGLFVRDNGVGFDMRYADKLFKVFERLHRAEDYEGTGIGLALVERIVARHGGQVWARGEPGRGATFWLSLPTATGKEAA